MIFAQRRRFGSRRGRRLQPRRVLAILSAGVALYAVALILTSPGGAQPAQSPTCTASGGGATILVGASRSLTTLSAGVAAASAGDTICMDPGDYVNDFVTIDKPVRILGVGGRARLIATVPPPNAKGIIVSQADLEIDNLEFSGAAISPALGNNAAGIRKEAGNLTIANSHFHDNQNGILMNDIPGAEVEISGSRFDNNGAGDGFSHGVYVNHIAKITVTESYFEAQHVGNHLKSRALETIVRGSTFEDGTGPGATTPSYSIDISEAGIAVIEGNTLIQRAAATNNGIIFYGGEAPDLPNSSLTVTGNTVINEDFNPRLLRNNSTTGVVGDISGNRIDGIENGNIADGQADPAPAANDFGPFSAPVLQNNGIVALATATAGRNVEEYDTGGSLQSAIEQPHGVAGNSGISALGGTLFVTNDKHGIAAVQGIGDAGTPTGTTTLYFGGPGIEALTTDGTDLYAGLFEDSSILRFDSNGNLLQTIALDQDIGITGLAWFDNLFFVANYDDGNVYTFDMLGNSQGAQLFATGLGAGLLSGLAYDPGLDALSLDDDSIWLATGFAVNGGDVLRYDLSGQLIDSFAAAGVRGLLASGSEILDSGSGDGDGGVVAMAEPAGLLLLSPALILLAATLRKRRRRT